MPANIVGDYGENMLVQDAGVRLEVQPFAQKGCVNEFISKDAKYQEANTAMPILSCPYAQLPSQSSSKQGCQAKSLKYRIEVNTTKEIRVVVDEVKDSSIVPSYRSLWSLTLRSGAHGIEVSVKSIALKDANITALRISMDFQPVS